MQERLAHAHGACWAGRAKATGWKPVLPARFLAEAGASFVARGGAAAAGGLQRGADGGSASGDGDGRIAERDRLGRFRAEVLRVGAPVERLIAECDAIVA